MKKTLNWSIAILLFFIYCIYIYSCFKHWTLEMVIISSCLKFVVITFISIRLAMNMSQLGK